MHKAFMALGTAWFGMHESTAPILTDTARHGASKRLHKLHVVGSCTINIDCLLSVRWFAACMFHMICMCSNLFWQVSWMTLKVLSGFTYHLQVHMHAWCLHPSLLQAIQNHVQVWLLAILPMLAGWVSTISCLSIHVTFAKNLHAWSCMGCGNRHEYVI